MLASGISRSVHIEQAVRADGNACLLAFTETLERNPETDIESFLSTRPDCDRTHLPSLIAVELRYKQHVGKEGRIESYFVRFPELKANREQVLDLIYAEFCERRHQGHPLDTEEFYHRFPDFKASLERLFCLDSAFGGSQLDMLPADETIPCLPEVGDTFLEFRLKGELGRGSSGRVFLAEQRSLSDRLVVVKITALRTIEHNTLARLSHPCIVPIHSVHLDEGSRLCAVCMPFQGAVAISDILRYWREKAEHPIASTAWLEAAGHLLSTTVNELGSQLDAPNFPIGKDYVTACSWLMYRLASALHHAHLRGIYHRDIKPSNILIAPTGQPLLVDFNLAFNQIDSGGDSRAFFGGTMAYMPPEQIQVLLSETKGRADDVGPRSDIFSLGATVYEMLTRKLPFEDLGARGASPAAYYNEALLKRGTPPVAAREWNPNVPDDLDALLARCLDPVPHNRYETAGQLAEDLMLLLNDRPLSHIGRVPIGLVVRKYLKRNKRRLALCTTGVVLGLGITVIIALTNRRAETHRLAREHAEQEFIEERLQREMVDLALLEARKTAEQEVDDSLESLPRNGYVYFRKGYDYFSGRRFHHALRAFERAMELGYESPHLFYFRARACGMLERDSEALENYSRSIAINPDFDYGYLGRAVFYATSRTHGDVSLAAQDLRKAIELKPVEEDESAKTFYLDLARVCGAIARAIPRDQEDKRAQILRTGEEFLVKSLKAGLTPSSIRELNESDTYRMLDSLLNLPSVQVCLDKTEAGNRIVSP